MTDDRSGTNAVTNSVTVHKNARRSPRSPAPATSSPAPLTAPASADPDGTIASYAWTFGDGATATTVAPSHTFTADGTYPVTLTVTDDSGAPTSLSKDVTVTAAPAGPIAADAFGRTVTRWGNADTGGAWTYSGSTFTTNGSVGKIALASPGVSATALLTGVSARDVNVLTDFSVDKMATGSGTYNSLLVRKVGTSDYRVAFQELIDGKVKLTISKTVGGTATVLKQVALTDLTYSAGDTIRIRFTATGNGTTALTAKAWKVGTHRAGHRPGHRQRRDGLAADGGLVRDDQLPGQHTRRTRRSRSALITSRSPQTDAIRSNCDCIAPAGLRAGVGGSESAAAGVGPPPAPPTPVLHRAPSPTPPSASALPATGLPARRRPRPPRCRRLPPRQFPRRRPGT